MTRAGRLKTPTYQYHLTEKNKAFSIYAFPRTDGVARQNCCSSGVLKALTAVKLKCVNRNKRLSIKVTALTVRLSQYDR